MATTHLRQLSTVAGLSSGVTAMHFHGPAETFGTAGVMFLIASDAVAGQTSGTVSGIWRGLTGAQIAALGVLGRFFSQFRKGEFSW